MARRLVTVEESAAGLEALSCEALDTAGLWPAVQAHRAQRARHSQQRRTILSALSDTHTGRAPSQSGRIGPADWPAPCPCRPTAGSCRAAGRAPTGRAQIKTLFGHVNTGRLHPEKITHPARREPDPKQRHTTYDTRRPHASLGYVTGPRTPTTKPRTRPGPVRRPRPDPARRDRLPSQQPTPQSSTHPPDAARGHLRRQRPRTDIRSATVRLLPVWLSTILDLSRSLRAAVTHSGAPPANARHHRCATPQRESPHPRASPAAGSRRSLPGAKEWSGQNRPHSARLWFAGLSPFSRSDPHRGKGTRTHPTRPKKFLVARNTTDFAPPQPPTTATNTPHPAVASPLRESSDAGHFRNRETLDLTLWGSPPGLLGCSACGRIAQ